MVSFMILLFSFAFWIYACPKSAINIFLKAAAFRCNDREADIKHGSSQPFLLRQYHMFEHFIV